MCGLLVSCALVACGLDTNGELAPDGGAQAPLIDASTPLVGPRDAGKVADASASFDAAARTPDSGDATVSPPDAGIDAGVDAGTPFCDAADPSLLVCFRFENQILDESSHAVAPMSSMVSYVAGVRGQAASFTPPSGQITLPNLPLWNVANVTVEAWVDPRSLPRSGARAGILDSDGRYGVFVYDPGTIDCLVQGVHLVGPVLAVNQWTHVACTYDGATVTEYVNGTARGTAPLGAAGSSNGTTCIGANSPSGDPFDGAIDELRVFSVARSAAQIAAAATP